MLQLHLHGPVCRIHCGIQLFCRSVRCQIIHLYILAVTGGNGNGNRQLAVGLHCRIVPGGGEFISHKLLRHILHGCGCLLEDLAAYHGLHLHGGAAAEAVIVRNGHAAVGGNIVNDVLIVKGIGLLSFGVVHAGKDTNHIVFYFHGVFSAVVVLGLDGIVAVRTALVGKALILIGIRPNISEQIGLFRALRQHFAQVLIGNMPEVHIVGGAVFYITQILPLEKHTAEAAVICEGVGLRLLIVEGNGFNGLPCFFIVDRCTVIPVAQLPQFPDLAVGNVKIFMQNRLKLPGRNGNRVTVFPGTERIRSHTDHIVIVKIIKAVQQPQTILKLRCHRILRRIGRQHQQAAKAGKNDHSRKYLFHKISPFFRYIDIILP